MGKFKIEVTEKDKNFGSKFFLKVVYNEFVTKNYLIFDPETVKYSPIMAEINKKVFNYDDFIQLKLNSDLNTDFLVIFMDKTKIRWQERG